VYVKDESPPKKKTTATVAVATTGTSEVEKQQHSKAGAAVTTATDGLNSLVQAAGIQIVSDADGTRVQQYKCAMQVSIHKFRACSQVITCPLNVSINPLRVTTKYLHTSHFRT
jgi:hypothetical protein